MKQLGFYLDNYGETGHWSVPDEIIDKKLAHSLVETAKILANQGDVTEREIDLWVQHMGPAWMTSDMRHALIHWQAAMHAEGLTERSASEMADFVFGPERGGRGPEGSSKPS